MDAALKFYVGTLGIPLERRTVRFSIDFDCFSTVFRLTLAYGLS